MPSFSILESIGKNQEKVKFLKLLWKMEHLHFQNFLIHDILKASKGLKETYGFIIAPFIVSGLRPYLSFVLFLKGLKS